MGFDTNVIDITANGATPDAETLDLPEGRWILSVSASTWSTASVAVEGKNGNSGWYPVKDRTETAFVVAASNDYVEVPGGMKIRVTTSTIGAAAGLKLEVTRSLT